MRRYIPEFILFFATMLFALFIAYSYINRAYGTERTEANATAETTVKGDRSSAIGVGGADYDIAGGTCRFHEGGLTIAWTRTDKFCQGMALIDRGFVDAGTRHICLNTDLGKNYPDTDACMAELKVVLVTPEPVAVESVDHDAEDEHQALAAEVQQLAEQLAVMEQRKPPPQVVRERTVEQRSYLTDEQKAKLREVISE